MEKVVQRIPESDGSWLDRAHSEAPDVKESFEVGREDDTLMPNIWLPDGVLPGFKEACLEFYWVSHKSRKRKYMLKLL